MKRKVSQSVEEAVASFSVDHIKTIVKGTVQRYIDSFLNRKGGNRSLLETFSREGLNYITDQSFNPEDDATLRKVQLARLFNQLQQKLPAILVVDAGFDYIPQNFTGLESAAVRDGMWYGTIQIVRQLNIQIIVATRDQSSTDFLQGLLSTLFGEMRFLAKGNYLTGNREQGETWVVTIGNPKLSSVTPTPVGEDPIDRVWFTTIELPDVMFEDRIHISQPIDKMGPPQQGDLNEADLGGAPPIIYLPDTVRINEPVQVLIDRFQPLYQRVIVTNPNIATYEPNSRTLNPRRLGTLKVQVVRNRKQYGDLPPGDQTERVVDVLSEKTVTVVAF